MLAEANFAGCLSLKQGMGIRLAWSTFEPRSGRFFVFGFGGVGLLAEVVPAGFGHVYTVVFCGGLDVGEGLFAFVIGDVFDLIEAGDGVADMGGVVQRLLALVGEGVDGFGEFGAAAFELGIKLACLFTIVLFLGQRKVSEYRPPGRLRVRLGAAGEETGLCASGGRPAGWRVASGLMRKGLRVARRRAATAPAPSPLAARS